MSQRIIRTHAAILTLIALILPGSLPTHAANGATIQGTVEVPCDPSRVREVAAVRIRSVDGGPPVTVPVYGDSGDFLGAGLTAGEYDVEAIDADGNPLSPEPQRLVLKDGPNPVVLSLEPADCGEPGGEDRPGDQRGAKPGQPGGMQEWKLSLIYVGAVGALALALDDRGEDAVSPFIP